MWRKDVLSTSPQTRAAASAPLAVFGMCNFSISGTRELLAHPSQHFRSPPSKDELGFVQVGAALCHCDTLCRLASVFRLEEHCNSVLIGLQCHFQS